MIDATVWTCPDCAQSYRMPAHWEAAVYLAARRTAQIVHASRHNRRALIENRRRATDSRPPGELPAEWADPAWAAPAPEKDDGTPGEGRDDAG